MVGDVVVVRVSGLAGRERTERAEGSGRDWTGLNKSRQDKTAVSLSAVVQSSRGRGRGRGVRAGGGGHVMRALFGGAHCCDRLPRSLTTSSREGARRVRLARSSRRLTRVWRAAQTNCCTATRCCSAGGAQEQELGKDETRQAGRDASDARRRQRCGLRSPLTTKFPRPLTREPEPFPLIVRAKRPHHPARCGRYKAGHAEEGKDASVRLRPIQSSQCHIAGRRGALVYLRYFATALRAARAPSP